MNAAAPLRLLVNGVMPVDPEHTIAASDRGLHYGDGVFETALLQAGRVRFLEDHLERLYEGCERLGMRGPARAGLLAEIEQVTAGAVSGVLKIVITRGPSARGYRPPEPAEPTRVVALHPAAAQTGVRELSLRWCAMPLGRNPRLAGIKHLNRLEQVLAQAEWRNERIDEGLMLDTEGELVCATASNVFIVRDGALLTPDLRFCGVRGIMRKQVLRAAAHLGIPASEEPLWPHDLEAASEVFLTNAVRGVRPAVALGSWRWRPGRIAQQLIAELETRS